MGRGVVDHHTEPLHRLLDGLQEPLPVRIIAMNPLALARSRRDMISEGGWMAPGRLSNRQESYPERFMIT